ncbi:MAG UNVERIFIED_CONTAM: hypothetical protein LVR18_23840 [Planctomycetaceae bacterium]
MTDLPVLSVPTIATPHPYRHPKAAGTVPATDSLRYDCDRSSGSIGSDDRDAPLTLPPPKQRGLSPQLSRSVTTVTDLPVLSVPTIATPHPYRHPKAAGTVPATDSLRYDCDRSSGSIGSDDRDAPLTLPPPKQRGQSPQPGRSVTTVNYLPVLSVLMMVPDPPTSPSPKQRGQSPQLSRCVTTVNYLPVLSVLTMVPAPPRPPPPSCRNCPRN